jgi:hypothetical protein
LESTFSLKTESPREDRGNLKCILLCRFLKSQLERAAYYLTLTLQHVRKDRQQNDLWLQEVEEKEEMNKGHTEDF